MADYREGLLVEAEWLAEHLADPNVRVIEMAQDGSDFETEHIPGAALSPTWQVKGSENKRLVAPADEAKAWFESVGIGDDTMVIAYDRFRSRDASRLWWVLSYHGHTNVRVLNGGWTKWLAEGRAVESGPSSVTGGGVSFTAKSPNHDIESTIEKLEASIGRGDTVIWDVRTVEEFTGANSRGNARVGHVPGAVHLEWVNLVSADDTFKSPEELEAIAHDLGITPEKTVHIY